MKIVVLGSSGMLGRILSLHLISKKRFKTKLFSRNKSRIKKVDKKINYLKDYTKKNIKKIIKNNRPCIVVNCIGVTNQNLNFSSYKNLNSKLPHMIKEQIEKENDQSKLIQISTDGVFKSRAKCYSEISIPNAIDNYGKSKKLGEVKSSPHLTIRTSIIGRSKNKNNLMNWILSSVRVKGYSNFIWNGVTSLECSKFIYFCILKNLTGVCHLSSTKISKFKLLNIIKDIYDLKKLTITQDNTKFFKRCLVKLRRDYVYKVPTYRRMIKGLFVFEKKFLK